MNFLILGIFFGVYEFFWIFLIYIFLKKVFLLHVDMTAYVTGQMMCSSHDDGCTCHMARAYVCACVRECS